MAELTSSSSATGDRASEAVLRARIGELEALCEARTHTIVGLSAQLAELRGAASSAALERLAEAKRELAELRATKVIRWSAAPRSLYARLRVGRG